MSTAILLVDLQNDFLAPDGAYGRAGMSSPDIAQLPGRLAPVLDAARTAGVPVISTQFTLAPCRGREPLIAEHLRELRPFLTKGDFEPGRRGHQLVDALAPADVMVEKVAFSAFYQSRLEWVLRGLGIEHLIVAGIVTNGGVASTVRDAHVRGVSTTVLQDGCAAFDREIHDATLRSLRGIARLSTCAETAAELAAAA